MIMDPKDKDLESQETNEQEDEVSDDENNPEEEGETSEGTEDEGSEEEGSEGNEQSEGESDQEAGQKESNKRSAQHRVSTRIKKLKGDLSQSESGSRELENQLAIANQRIEIMQLANNQKGADKKPVEPSPDDYEDGVQDPKYAKAIRDFDKAQNREEIRQEFVKQNKTVQNSVAQGDVQRNSERKQREHYRKALDNNSDYEEKEDSVISIIGTDAVKDIIDNFEDADKIIYRLGADENLAFDVADALESKKHVLVVRLLERASGSSFKPKTKLKPTPNPDKKLPGGSPGATTGFEAKRLKMLKKATDMNDQSIYSDFMDQHRKEEKVEMAKHTVW